jgi:hypothetical protein
MASEALFSKLAEALSLPSHAYYAAMVGLAIPEAAIGGYLQGGQISDILRQRRMERMSLEDAFEGNVPDQLKPFSKMPFDQATKILPLINKTFATQVNFLTPDQAKAAGVTPELIESYGGKPIPRQVAATDIQRTTAPNRLMPLVQQRQRVLDWQKWNTVTKQANAFVQGSGPVGIASKNNMRGMRAMSLLNKPGPLTPQEYDYITADMAGIMQGGVPLQEQLRDQRFGNTLSSIAQTLSRIKSQPETVNTPEIRALLKANMKHILDVDNAVINNNLAFLERAHADIINQHRSEWDAAKQAIMRGEQMPTEDMTGGGGIGDLGTGDPEADAAIAQINAAEISPNEKQARIQAVKSRVGTR